MSLREDDCMSGIEGVAKSREHALFYCPGAIPIVAQGGAAA
jgi:hypothetical protein